MGWSIGYDPNYRRDIGYGVPAICDHPGCDKEIDRGLGYVCGGEPYGGDEGCGLFFCGEHLAYYNRGTDTKPEWSRQLCSCCGEETETQFDPKPDTQEWIDWKMTDDSWETWRSENPAFVEKHGGSSLQTTV